MQTCLDSCFLRDNPAFWRRQNQENAVFINFFLQIKCSVFVNLSIESPFFALYPTCLKVPKPMSFKDLRPLEPRQGLYPCTPGPSKYGFQDFRGYFETHHRGKIARRPHVFPTLLHVPSPFYKLSKTLVIFGSPFNIYTSIFNTSVCSLSHFYP